MRKLWKISCEIPPYSWGSNTNHLNLEPIQNPNVSMFRFGMVLFFQTIKSFENGTPKKTRWWPFGWIWNGRAGVQFLNAIHNPNYSLLEQCSTIQNRNVSSNPAPTVYQLQLLKTLLVLLFQMGPLIDAELERVDRRHAQLTRLSTELVDALNLYHQVKTKIACPVLY